MWNKRTKNTFSKIQEREKAILVIWQKILLVEIATIIFLCLWNSLHFFWRKPDKGKANPGLWIKWSTPRGSKQSMTLILVEKETSVSVEDKEKAGDKWCEQKSSNFLKLTKKRRKTKSVKQLIEKTTTGRWKKENNWKVKILLLQFFSLNGDKTTRKQEKKPKRLMHHFGWKKRNLRITLKSFFYSHFSRLAFVARARKKWQICCGSL